MNTYNFLISESPAARLDVYLSKELPEISRANIQRLIASGHILVNSVMVRAGYKPQIGDSIDVVIPPPEPTYIIAQDIPLDIVYEDKEIIVINKAKGMTVHPAPGNRTDTLVNAILAYSTDLSGVGGVERPGIVHRLDKDTSGLLVVAKSDAAHSSLQKQIQARTAHRRYIALVWNETKFNEAEVDAPIGRHPSDRQRMAIIKDTSRYTSREARTHLFVTERFKGFTLLECKLDTGRTHQIRVHTSFIGHPVVGDPVYGGTKRALPSAYGKVDQKELLGLIENLHGQALHAVVLEFDHPSTGERLSFSAPIPDDLQNIINWLRIKAASEKP